MLTTYSICILTLNRNKLLEQMLNSILAEKNWSNDHEIIIIDSSGTATAEKLVTTFQKTHKEIKYLPAEKRLSIPQGRNKAVALASKDYIIFMDDDQKLRQGTFDTITQEWHKFKNQYSGAQLGVEYICSDPNNKLNNIIKKKRTNYPHGEPMKAEYISTDGAIIDRKIFTQDKIKFDEKWAYSGGDDTAFFAYCGYKGHKFVSLSKAIVIDYAQTDRINIKYLLKDSFRKGLCRAKLLKELPSLSNFKQKSLTHKTYLLLKFTAEIIIAITMLPIFLIKKNYSFAEWLCFIARQIGKFFGLMGFESNMYKQMTNVTTK